MAPNVFAALRVFDKDVFKLPERYTGLVQRNLIA